MKNILIKFPEGTDLVSIGTTEDLLYYVEEYMGTEYRKCVEEVFGSKISEAELEKEYINEKLEEANAELDDKDDVIRETLDSVEELLEQELPEETKNELKKISNRLWMEL